LAESFYYNSPYAFSENHVIAHIELEGLEKVTFQQGLLQNENYKKILNVQAQTSGGKRFRDKFVNQNEYNILYFTHDGVFDGANTSISSIEEFNSLKDNLPIFYGDLEENLVKDALGDNKLILININDKFIEKEDLSKTKEGSYTLNHEEYHAEKTIEGVVGKNKNPKDHLGYYGEYRSDSPNDSDVKNMDMYKNSEAKKQMDEIDSIIKRDYER
jgi:hypothetical protein